MVYRSAIFHFQPRAVCIRKLVSAIRYRANSWSFTPGSRETSVMLVNFQIDVSLIRPAVSQYSDSVPSWPTYSVKRWQLENKTLQFLYGKCSFYVVPYAWKENTLDILFSVKCKITFIVCKQFVLLLITYYWNECFDSLCNDYINAWMQRQLEIPIWLHLKFPSSHSIVAELHTHDSIETCLCCMIAEYIPSLLAHAKMRGLVCCSILWDEFEW